MIIMIGIDFIYYWSAAVCENLKMAKREGEGKMFYALCLNAFLIVM